MQTTIARLLFPLIVLSYSSVTAASIDQCLSTAADKNYAKTIQYCQASAEEGNLDAAFHMGEAYEYIRGPQRNGTRAAKWYMKAAEQGHLLAQRNLAALYDSGFGVPKNSWLAFRWYHRAAEKGQPHSQLMVGMMYLDGTGTLKDHSKGMLWLKRAAQAGEPNAQYMYGKTRYEEDSSEALDWYRKSANQGNSYALYRLGLLYYRGENLPKDNQQALHYAEKALAAGHPRAEILKNKVLEQQPTIEKTVIAQSNKKPIMPPIPAVSDARLKVALPEQKVLAESANSIKTPPQADKSSHQKQPTPQVAAITQTPKQPEARKDNKVAKAEPEVKSAGRVSVESESDGAKWLLEQPSNHYTIQLALMSQLDSVKRFFRWYGLEDQSHFYQSSFNAGPMWVLIYGDFSTLQDAQQAINKLPPKVRKMKPWVRQLDTLQKSYKPLSP